MQVLVQPVRSTRPRYLGLDVLLHLTCVGMTRAEAKATLDAAKEKGVRNLLANRGDAAGPQHAKAEFPHAVDLVRFIRQECAAAARLAA